MSVVNSERGEKKLLVNVSSKSCPDETWGGGKVVKLGEGPPYHSPCEPLVPEGRTLLQTEQGAPNGGPKSCSNSGGCPC